MIGGDKYGFIYSFVVLINAIRFENTTFTHQVKFNLIKLIRLAKWFVAISLFEVFPFSTYHPEANPPTIIAVAWLAILVVWKSQNSFCGKFVKEIGKNWQKTPLHNFANTETKSTLFQPKCYGVLSFRCKQSNYFSPKGCCKCGLQRWAKPIQ